MNRVEPSKDSHVKKEHETNTEKPETLEEACEAIRELSQVVDENFTNVVQAHNGLIERIRYTTNLGEILIEALIEKEVLTMEDLNKAKEKLEAEALQRQQEKSENNKEEN